LGDFHAAHYTADRKGYNFFMPDFNFYHPIEVRYGDLDPQGHLNNAKYLTYMEQARIAYIKRLRLWGSGSFMDIGIILADAQITFLAPVLFAQPVQVGVRVTRLGNKSLTMIYRLEDAGTGAELATGTTVLVAYDYHSGQTIPVPDSWRRTITEFERLTS
jgi:acyl-CoA thioester hydrolase